MGSSSLSIQLLIFLLPHFIMALGSAAVAKHSIHKKPVPAAHSGFVATTAADDLSFDHYARTCPNMEAVVHKKIKHWTSADPSLAPALIRLHFHDCAVRGCDGSILLNHKGSERRAKASETLRGFQVIDDIKAELEKKCPKTVSCADVLTAAARDATLKVGGPFWENLYGRKDGSVSLAHEADLVPMGRENITHLLEFFQSKGLNLLDLVVLSGSHTIGRSTCASIQDRLYNFTGTGRPDPSIDGRYLNFLNRKCRWASEEYVELDGTTPTKFDAVYYQNLQKKMGLLQTDQLLYSDSRTGPIVAALASQQMLFYQQFAVSMVNLGNVQVLTGTEGKIRTNCNYV